MAIYIALSAVLGLIFGSFLNALAYRLPRHESLMTRSHCTVCHKQITAWENIPVLSWIFLRGRCSGCKTPISTRYPIVELTTAIVFGTFTAVAFSLGDGFLFTTLILLSFAFVGTLVALIDLDTFKIPANAVYWGFIVAIIGAIGYQLFTGDQERGWRALLFMALYGAVYFIIWFFSPRAMGFGDVRLAPLVGFVLGWVSLGTAAVGFFLPWVLAFLWAIPALIRGKASLTTKIPFGPWIILGSFIAIAFGDILFSGYLQIGSIR